MVDLFIPEQEDDTLLRQNFFSYDKTGTLDVLGATLRETIYYNPASALTRMGEQYLAKDEGRLLSSDEWQESEFYREGIEEVMRAYLQEKLTYLPKDMTKEGSFKVF